MNFNMRVHFPEAYEAHRLRNREFLEIMALDYGLTYEQFMESNWDTTGKETEMPDVEIDDAVPLPPSEETPKRRGRPKGSTANKPAQNFKLLSAVEFIAIVQTDAFEMSKYAAISNGEIAAYSNILSAGYPVQEALNRNPHIDKLKAALQRSGRTLSITETASGLAVKGDKLRAVVPCLAEPLAPVEPDAIVLTGEFDALKAAFHACATVADEKADRPMFASVLLDPSTATATNGKVMLQFWHGIQGLPPGTVLPRSFTQAIASVKYKITGIGAAWDNERGFATSFTIHFENGAWLKTQCYEDRWQEISHVIDVPTAPVTLYDGLFDAIIAVEPFCEDSEAIFFVEDGVQSHSDESQGAVYPVKDLPAGKVFNARLIKQVAPYVKTIDLTTHEDRAFFFGGTEQNPVRGVFMAMRA